MRNLHQQLCNRGDRNDFIGLGTISSEKFNHGPLCLSFRPVKNLKGDDIWKLLFNTVQSAGDFNIDDKLSINCAIIKGTSGRGRVRLTEETVSKRSILTIKNSDNLCLPRNVLPDAAIYRHLGDFYEYEAIFFQ